MSMSSTLIFYTILAIPHTQVHIEYWKQRQILTHLRQNTVAEKEKERKKRKTQTWYETLRKEVLDTRTH